MVFTCEREVPAAYTSKRLHVRVLLECVVRMCESEGLSSNLPLRHKQIAVADQKTRTAVRAIARKILAPLCTHWATMPDAKRAGACGTNSYRGGEVFVFSAKKKFGCKRRLCRPRLECANIGLKALLDPDWSGRWWYVPCDASTD